jgi:hypothetical protein
MNKKNINPVNKDLSVSMYLDNDNEISPSIRKDIFKSFSADLTERKRYIWVKDENITNCQKCNIQFSFLNRKHHCRNCGKIFCYICSSYFIEIPYNSGNLPKKEWNYLNIKDYFNFSEKERSCKECFDNLIELKKLSKLITVFELLPIDIKDYRNIAQVCKSWNQISKYYLSSFREIQYFFPDHIYKKREKLILKQNKQYFKCHSKWLVQLIISTDWENETDEYRKEIIEIINSKERNTTCWELMCTRSCQEKLQCEDLFLILSRKLTYLPIIYNIIDLLKKCNINEISYYLSWFINLMHYYKDFSNIADALENTLIDKSIVNLNICNQLFWTLTQNIKDKLSSSDYFKQFRLKLVQKLEGNTYKLFQNGYDFTMNIIQLAETYPENTNEFIKKHLKEYNFNNKKTFYLPVNFNQEFNGISIDDIKTIDSKTKPIILPCKYQSINSMDNELYYIMLKKDDVRKEEIVMKMIGLMDHFLKIEENIDFEIITYNILPLSEKYGYVQFVPNSKTLYHVKEDLGFSIQNYILESNEISFNSFRDKFTKSCAAYCVITYLLGIGDRHLDNIMITNNGSLFHIDYGFILGKDPKPVHPEIRITPEMIDAMGGKTSANFNLFKEYCGRIFNCLRRHAPTFYTMLIALTEFHPSLNDVDINRDYIYNFIISRFIPGESYKEAEQQFKHKIDINSNTYSENIIDYFHKRNKSDSNTNINKSEPTKSLIGSFLSKWL